MNTPHLDPTSRDEQPLSIGELVRGLDPKTSTSWDCYAGEPNTPRLDRPHSSGVRATPLKRGTNKADNVDVIVILASLQSG